MEKQFRLHSITERDGNPDLHFLAVPFGECSIQCHQAEPEFAARFKLKEMYTLNQILPR